MSDRLSALLPSAKQVMEQLAVAEAEKAAAEMRRQAKADAEKKALIDRLTRPSGVSDEEALKRVATIVQRAVKNGLTEVEVIRFPNSMCTDRGRAINNNLEPGWEKTLAGLLKETVRILGTSTSSRAATRSDSRSPTFPAGCRGTSASR
jgi:hypothetical protein